jgi:hypothetical protein
LSSRCLAEDEEAEEVEEEEEEDDEEEDDSVEAEDELEAVEEVEGLSLDKAARHRKEQQQSPRGMNRKGDRKGMNTNGLLHLESHNRATANIREQIKTVHLTEVFCGHVQRKKEQTRNEKRSEESEKKKSNRFSYF